MKIKTIAALILFNFNLVSKAQISCSRLSLNSNSLVHVIMPDTTSETSKQYMDVYKKHWTFSKIRFVSPNEKRELYKAENIFMGFSCYKKRETDTEGHQIIYMQVWLKLYQVKKGDKGTLNEYEMASFLLPMNNLSFFLGEVPGMFHYGSCYEIDIMSYDLGGNMFLWGPGLLKNHIQKLGILVKNNGAVKKSKSSPVDNHDEIVKLKTDILYIPEYCLKDYSWFDNQYKDNLRKEKKVFGKYPYQIIVLNEKELNQKILYGEEFYYLVYTSDRPRKYVNIINSKTGEIIYSSFSTPSYEFKKGDMKDITKAIRKSSHRLAKKKG